MKKKLHLRRIKNAKKNKTVTACKFVPFPDFPPPYCAPSWDKANKMINWLRLKKFDVLGSGCYTTVLGKKNSDRVIRVTRMNDNWIDYIQWAAKNGYCGNFAPRVYSWKRHGDWSVSVVERMDQTLSQAHESDYALLEALRWKAAKGHTLAQVYMEDIAPGSVKFFDDLGKELQASDIYGKNMMIRKDGTFCLTDPVCGRIKTEARRLRSADLSATPIYGLNIESRYRYRGEWITQSNENLGRCL